MVLMVATATLVDAGYLRKRRFLVNDSPQAVFDQAGSGLDFEDTVDALKPYIHSDMTVFACIMACQAAAASVLGPAAFLSGVLCPPLCDEGLKRAEAEANNH